MRGLTKDSIQTLLVRVPVLIITFLHTILLIRLLGADGNGVYVFLLANAQLGTILFSLNLAKVFTYFLASGKFPRGKIVGLALWILIIAILLFLSIVLGSFLLNAPWLNLLLPSGYENLFFCLFLVFYFLFLMVQLFCKCLLQGGLKFKQVNLFALISNAILLVGLATLFFLNYSQVYHFSLKHVLGITLCIHVFNSILLIYLTQRALRIKIDFRFRNIGLIRPFFDYAIKGYLTNISNFLNKRIDIWFVESFHGVAKLGVYGLAGSLINFMLSSLQPLNQVIMPYMTQMDEKEGNQMLLIYSRLVFLLAVTMALGVFLLAPWLVPFLFGKDFMGAVLPVRILLVGFVLLSIRTTFGSYAYARNHLNYLVNANLLALGVTIVLDILLIPKFGIVGASIASVCAYFTSIAYLVINIVRDLESPWYQFFIFGKEDWNYWKKQLK